VGPEAPPLQVVLAPACLVLFGGSKIDFDGEFRRPELGTGLVTLGGGKRIRSSIGQHDQPSGRAWPCR
jgi:hypothetical protein